MAGPRTITIDRTAPGALSVVGGDASRATNSFDVSWTNPTGQLAPIARAHYLICPAFGVPAGRGDARSVTRVGSVCPAISGPPPDGSASPSSTHA
jgi:hypothetical protein